MARKSITAKALEDAGHGEYDPERPEPLPGMPREQRDLWRVIVGRMPARWFPGETHELLAQYCRHACEARYIDGLITAHKSGEPDPEDEWLKQYHLLTKIRDQEGQAMSSLATRLRITQQSTVNPKIQKPVEPDAPWE